MFGVCVCQVMGLVISGIGFFRRKVRDIVFWVQRTRTSLLHNKYENGLSSSLYARPLLGSLVVPYSKLLPERNALLISVVMFNYIVILLLFIINICEHDS